MGSLIDAYVSASWYLDHVRPVIDALGKSFGTLYEGSMLHSRPDKTRLVLVTSYGDLQAARRAGWQRFALAQHGAGQSYGGDPRPPSRANYPSYPGGRDHGDVGLFLVPNEHAANRWREAYPRAKVAVTGCPKLETLPQRQPGPGPVVAISFHWDFRNQPETVSAFRDYAHMLKPLAQRFTVLGHGHPKRRDLERVYGRVGIEYVPSFADICRRADLYVFDNSSSGFEFAATGRPVVVLNTRQYRRTVEHGLRFWTAAGVGVNVWSGRELVPAIERALECCPEDVAAREAALATVYQPRTGGAALAAAALREIA